MKKDAVFPNKTIYAVCKEDIKGAFESHFMAGNYYKGLKCQMDINKPYFIYVITDDNGFDFSFFASSEEASLNKFSNLFKVVTMEDYNKHKTYCRFDL